MANWTHRLNLKVEWELRDQGELTVQQLAARVAAKLKKVDFNDDDVNFDRDDIVDEFEGLSEDPSASVEDFDDVLARLYDFADEDKRLWVATF